MLSLPLLLILFAPPSAAPGGVADLDGASWRRLVGDGDQAPRDPLVDPPWALDREVVVRKVKGGLRVHSRWEVRALEAGWLDRVLVAGRDVHVESFTFGGRSASITAEDLGDGVVRVRVTGKVPKTRAEGIELELDVFVPGDDAQGLDLVLMPAVRGILEVDLGEAEPLFEQGDSPGPVLLSGGGRRRYLTGDERVNYRVVGVGSAAEPASMIVAHTGMGITIGEGELRGRGHVVWEVRRGSLEEVRLRGARLGKDLELSGPNVASWRRDGEELVVVLRESAKDRVDVHLRWTRALGNRASTSVELPTVEPLGVFRSDAAVQLARDTDLEVLPRLDELQPVAGDQLPTWARGLVDGTPTAAAVGSSLAGASLDLLRFEPVEAPPVVIDVVDYEVAVTREGRAVIRAKIQLRNERASHLHLELPKGLKLLGVRVAGNSTAPARDDGGTWRIPLKRSVETVEGLLSVPVELALMGEFEAFDPRERRDFPLPRFDAEVAVSRTTLYLPPGWHSKQKVGRGHVVSGFSKGEGITYGFGTGEAEKAEAADAVFQQAVDDWMSNDFGGAQDKLDVLREIGAANEDMDRLQANLDVIEGKGKGDKVVTRRIKEQAKARAKDELAQQQNYRSEADQLRIEGRYDEAKERYAAAIDIGEQLAKLEQSESVEQERRNVMIEKDLKRLETETAAVERRSRVQKRPASKKKDKTPGWANEKAPQEAAPASGVDEENEEARPPATVVDQSRSADTTGKAGEAGDVIEGEGQFEDDQSVAVPPPDDARPLPEQDSPEPTRAMPSNGARGRVIVRDRPRGGGGKTLGAKAPSAPVLDARSKSTRSRRTFATATGATTAAPAAKPQPKQKKSKRAPAKSERGPAHAEDLPAAFEGAAPGSPNESLPEIVVGASSLSVVIPKVGEPVRYQHLLLPAGARPQLEIHAKAPRRRAIED